MILLPRKTAEIAVVLMRHLFQSMLVMDMKSRYKQTSCWAMLHLSFTNRNLTRSFCIRRPKMYCAIQKYNGTCFEYLSMKDCVFCLRKHIFQRICLCMSVCVFPTSLSANLYICQSVDSKWSQHWVIFMIQVSQRTSLTEAKDYLLWKWRTTWWK